jgi:hypothetical protein
VNTSPPSWLVFVLGATVALLLGDGLYASYRRGAISYTRWYGRDGPYRRATEPFRYWLCMAMTGFCFVVCTLAAALMLFLMVMGH